jgi:hypothetical protein
MRLYGFNYLPVHPKIDGLFKETFDMLGTPSHHTNAEEICIMGPDRTSKR